MDRGCLGAVGIGTALIGGLFLSYFAVQSATGGDGKTEPAVYAGLIVFFGGLLAAGAYLAWRMLRPKPAASGAARPGTGGSDGSGGSGGSGGSSAGTEADRERRVLRLAERERGRVTVPEVAAQCDMTIAEAKTELDRLVLLGAARIQVTAAGVLVYVFHGFLSDKDKQNATEF